MADTEVGGQSSQYAGDTIHLRSGKVRSGGEREVTVKIINTKYLNSTTNTTQHKTDELLLTCKF